jgi:hypothetical protein
MKSYYILYPAIFLALLISVTVKSSRHKSAKAEQRFVHAASEMADAPDLPSKLKN